MAVSALRTLALVSLTACSDVSTEGTVFACDPDHPCPADEVCSGEVGVCLDHAVLLYEDFEQPLDATRWKIVETNGMVNAASSVAHWGRAGMRSDVPASGGLAVIEHAWASPLPSTTYVRWFVRQTAFVDSTAYVKLETRDESTVLTIGNESGRTFIKGGSDPTYNSASSTGSLVADAWTCIEVALTGLPAAGAGTLDARVFVGEVELPELHLTTPTRAFELLRVGSSALGAASILVDDIVVDATRVGCAR